MRCHEKFELFWKDVQNNAVNLRIDPLKLPRKRRAPPKIEEYLGGNTAPEFDGDMVSYYRKTYCKAMDCITSRFDHQHFETYIILENHLIKAAKGDNFHAEYDDILSIYYKDFDDNRFLVQLETLSKYCKELDIISVRTIAEVL